jgi:hypothetical protein
MTQIDWEGKSNARRENSGLTPKSKLRNFRLVSFNAGRATRIEVDAESWQPPSIIQNIRVVETKSSRRNQSIFAMMSRDLHQLTRNHRHIEFSLRIWMLQCAIQRMINNSGTTSQRERSARLVRRSRQRRNHIQRNNLRETGHSGQVDPKSRRRAKARIPYTARSTGFLSCRDGREPLCSRFFIICLVRHQIFKGWR